MTLNNSIEFPKTTHQEIETSEFNNTFTFKFSEDGKFTQEQTDKIRELTDREFQGRFVEDGEFIPHRRFKHIIFQDSEALYICIANEGWHHNRLWINIQNEFGQDCILKDAGRYCISNDGEHIIKRYCSISLKDEISPEECYSCRDSIKEMNVGIRVLD